MVKVIDGKLLAAEVLEDVKLRVDKLKSKNIIPCLCLIRIGNDPASEIYVKGKINDCQKVGIRSEYIHLQNNITQEELLFILKEKNQDKLVHGILVQLPIPKHLDSQKIIANISPTKDADGFHTINAGMLAQGNINQATIACTPAGILKMLESTNIELSGKNAVIIGRSNIVGKPMALLLISKNCTVTICHSQTKNLPSIVANADILIIAIGKSEFIKAEWIKKGAVVIDVGMNKNSQGKLTGDLEFNGAKERAAYISPVPGGVGPMTRAMLLSNTVHLAEKNT